MNKISVLILAVFALNGCVSTRTFNREVDLAYKQGYVDAWKKLEPKLKQVEMQFDDLSKWVLDALNLPDSKLK